MKLLKKLYSIYSPSKGEKKMKRFIKRWIRTNIEGAKIHAENRNLYITKGVSDTYPCVAAHLDQVQKIHSDDFTTVETEDIILGYSPSNRQQEGLGADDKNGIWIALKCLQKYDVIKVALFYGKGIGWMGANRADINFFDDVRFIIEPDRRGYKDLITTIGNSDLCSDAFVEATECEKYGYSPTEGLMTDVEVLRERGVTACCVNVSCGYYEPHTDVEFTVKKDLFNCLKFVKHIIENVTERMEYEDVH